MRFAAVRLRAKGTRINDAAACRALGTLASQLRALAGQEVADTEAVRASLARIGAFMGCGAQTAPGCRRPAMPREHLREAPPERG
jgi:hypothetical protein